MLMGDEIQEVEDARMILILELLAEGLTAKEAESTADFIIWYEMDIEGKSPPFEIVTRATQPVFDIELRRPTP